MSTEPVLSLAGARRTAPPAVVRPVTPGAYESWGAGRVYGTPVS
jgi:hypothetical protein